MFTKETAQKLENQLRYGDKRRISKLAGCSPLSVVRFFNGEIDKISPELQDNIIEQTNFLLNDRQKRAKAHILMADLITGNI
jgi:hypothetical protein